MANATNVTNSTNFSSFVEGELLLDHYVLLYSIWAIQYFVIIFGCLGNSLFCVTIIRYPRLHTPFNALAFALSVGDLLTSATAVPLNHALSRHFVQYGTIYDTPLCYSGTFLLNVFKWNSVLIMTEMAILRARVVFSKVVDPLRRRTVVKLIVGNVFATSAFSTYRTFFNKNNVCASRETDNGNRLLNIAVFSFLYVNLIISYVILSTFIHYRSVAMPDGARNPNRYEIATIRASAIIVTSYLVAHLPYIVYTLFLHFGVATDTSFLLHTFLTNIFSLCNVSDTVIFSVISSQYREHVFLLLRGTRTKTKNPMIDISSST